MSIRVILDNCVGCKLCIDACSYQAIDVVDKKAAINLNVCTLCGACIDACKFDAIVLKKDLGMKKDLSEYKDVWVFCEQKKEKFSP